MRGNQEKPWWYEMLEKEGLLDVAGGAGGMIHESRIDRFVEIIPDILLLAEERAVKKERDRVRKEIEINIRAVEMSCGCSTGNCWACNRGHGLKSMLTFLTPKDDKEA